MSDGDGVGSATSSVIVRGEQAQPPRPGVTKAAGDSKLLPTSVSPGHSLGNPSNDLRTKDEILARLTKLNDKPSLTPAEQQERQTLLLALKRKVAEEGAVDALMTADALIHGANTNATNRVERQSNIDAALDSYLAYKALLEDTNQGQQGPAAGQKGPAPAAKRPERNYVFVETLEPLDTKPAPKLHAEKHGPVNPAKTDPSLFVRRK